MVRDEARNGSVLDIGVGAGRTTALLETVGTDYTGIDYTEELVAICRADFPDRRVMHMDARDLSAFADNSFGLAVFSYNGLDAVDYDDRVRILREVNRVLRPDGFFVFSSHNRDGPGFEERPLSWFHWTANPVRLGWRVLNAALSVPGIVNYRRYRHRHRDGDGWAIRTAAAHNFGIVIVYTTMREQKRLLAANGFRTEAVFSDSAGESLTDASDTSETWWFHFVARKIA